jgi:protein-disulfide isomerase
MAKTKKKKKESKEEVVINLDNAGVPIAIIISGILIAAVIFFAFRNNAPVTTDTEGESGEVVSEETAPTGEGEFTAATAEVGDSPYLGDKDSAKVAVVEYNDYRCGYCVRHKDETFPLIIENYVDTRKVIYVFKDFAIYGDDIANAAKCVYHLEDTDIYVDFHNQAFNLEGDDAIYALASEVGVNESEFDACYSESKYQDEIDAEKASGEQAGVQGTPGFVIGTLDEDGNVTGSLVPGAYPYETFVETIEGLLE